MPDVLSDQNDPPHDFWRDELRETAQLFAAAASGDRAGVIKMLGEYVLRTQIQNAATREGRSAASITDDRGVAPSPAEAEEEINGDTEEIEEDANIDAEELDYDDEYHEAENDENDMQHQEDDDVDGYDEDEWYEDPQDADDEYDNYNLSRNEAVGADQYHDDATYDMQTTDKRVRFADEEGAPIMEEFDDDGWDEAAAQDSNNQDSFYDNEADYEDYQYDDSDPYQGDQSSFNIQDDDLPYMSGGLGAAEGNDIAHEEGYIEDQDYEAAYGYPNEYDQYEEDYSYEYLEDEYDPSYDESHYNPTGGQYAAQDYYAQDDDIILSNHHGMDYGSQHGDDQAEEDELESTAEARFESSEHLEIGSYLGSDAEYDLQEDQESQAFQDATSFDDPGTGYVEDDYHADADHYYRHDDQQYECTSAQHWNAMDSDAEHDIGVPEAEDVPELIQSAAPLSTSEFHDDPDSISRSTSQATYSSGRASSHGDLSIMSPYEAAVWYEDEDTETLSPLPTSSAIVNQKVSRLDVNPFYNSAVEGQRFYDRYQPGPEDGGRRERVQRPQTLVDRFRSLYRD